MNNRTLKKYAKLIVKTGVNIKKGQLVVVTASIDCADLVRLVVEEAYKAKASYVRVDWQDATCVKSTYMHASLEVLSELPKYAEEKVKWFSEELPCMIHIMSDDPDAFAGVDQAKVMKARQAQYPILKKYYDAADEKYQWTIVAMPSVAWAKKVFPEDKEKVAVKKLWDAILKTARCDGKDPVKDWKEHNEFLLAQCTKLNNLDFDYLQYKNSKGTDLKLHLCKGTMFLGGGETTLKGRYYNPNMPTEECFGIPDKNHVDGVVYSAKPLSVQGVLVDNFGFRFKDGKVIEVLAEKPEHKEVLEKLVNMDEGASRLGEVALVPYDSPISQSGILFYNTLFDENASCHLALGRGFNNCIKGFAKLSPEEVKSYGINESMIHVDFMIGTKDLSIVGVTSKGEEVVVFKDGNWAI